MQLTDIACPNVECVLRGGNFPYSSQQHVWSSARSQRPIDAGRRPTELRQRDRKVIWDYCKVSLLGR